MDWASIAYGLADKNQTQILWKQLKDNEDFYYGGVPTAISTKPETYEEWEFSIKDNKHELASMGRVWYIESMARARMGDGKGLIKTIRKVAEIGKENKWFWRERYKADPQGSYLGYGPDTYCEYPANLIRITNDFVFGVKYELDGSISFNPCVPGDWWEKGFSIKLRGKDYEFKIGN